MKNSSKVKGFSLKTQIYSLVFFLGLLSFAGTLFVTIESTKDYLNEQMGSHAQDTATSLGLSISPYLGTDNSDDLIIAETMVSAIFDRGYYASISLISADNQTNLISRENPKTVETVPSWFIEWFTLTPPTKFSEINTGWQIAGTLKVTSHAGSSYLQLWQYGQNAFIAFFLILLVSLILAYFILNAVLEPLSQVEAQAIALSKKQFNINPKQPFTRELNVVVNALNTMVANLQNNFDSLTKQTEKFTKEAYIDKLTGLANRRAFENQFNVQLQALGENDIGTIALIELPRLQQVNTQNGYQAGDAYVTNAVNVLKEAFGGISDAKYYRLNGGSFIVTIAHPFALCQEEIKKAESLFIKLNAEENNHQFANIVATAFRQSTSLQKLLSELDTLLTQKSSSFANKEDAVDSNSQPNENSGLSLGVQQWNSLINDLLQAGHIEFSYQSVRSLPNQQSTTVNQTIIKQGNKTYYNELLAKFYFNDEVIPNNQLFAMAERLGLTQKLDESLITEAINFITPQNAEINAINLSQQSLLSESFVDWLTGFVEKNPLCKNNIYFEINEIALLKDIELASKHIDAFKALDIGIVIERFGTSFTSFKYLRGLDLDFIKIDGSYVRDLSKNQDNNYFIQAVNQICHGLGIKVIACHIENQEILSMIETLGCDAVQGQFIQEPTPLTKPEQN
ncbi:MAG: bifunctional diguanylate cyclase/phosphodiesterase [Colwellia sp.]